MSPNGKLSTVGRRLAAAVARIHALIPGVFLCGFVTSVAVGFQHWEERAFAHPYIEALVIAIVLGMGVRSVWNPPDRWRVGIAFSAKQVLEVAVMLLGASISFAAIAESGVLLLAIIVFTVGVSLGASYALSRVLGLPTKLSILIACGNSICGNSAIATVAPVIGADGDDIASSISFTAILGVLMVLGLPLLIPLLRLSATQYGILAGLTVYAVPQVLAATVPAGLASTQIGTIVKLVRVLMLGPLVVGLSIASPRFRKDGRADSGVRSSPFKLMDEPAAGTSPDERLNLVKLINGLSSELTILLVEHDMDVVFAICDVITVLSYGKLLATGTKAEIQSDPQVIEAYLGQHHA